jgi:hypothetical protein
MSATDPLEELMPAGPAFATMVRPELWLVVSQACRTTIGWVSVRNLDERSATMGMEETGHITGTKDKDYNIIWFVEQCLSNALRLETYIEDAERDGDSELADFFRRAQGESRKGAEQGKQLLRRRLG